MDKKNTFLCFIKVINELGKSFFKLTWKITVVFLALIFDMLGEHKEEPYSSDGFSKNSDGSGYSEADLYSNDLEHTLHPWNINNEENN